MEKLTIKEIARLAGVSVATVSYIINGINEERYTKETKQRVLQIVNLYNYRPSRLAQSLANNKTNNIILLTDKHGTLLQKAESYDLCRMLCKALEKMGYNLMMRAHLDATRVDTADAIVCAGIEEERFLRLAKENFVPLLTIDAKINDELFFQVYQDFEHLMRAGVERFGTGNFTVALVDTYNETLKADIRAVCGSAAVFLSGDAQAVPQGNVVTVNECVTKLCASGGGETLFLPALTQDRIDAVIDCYKKAASHAEVDTHRLLVK